MLFIYMDKSFLSQNQKFYPTHLTIVMNSLMNFTSLIQFILIEQTFFDLRLKYKEVLNNNGHFVFTKHIEGDSSCVNGAKFYFTPTL